MASADVNRWHRLQPHVHSLQQQGTETLTGDNPRMENRGGHEKPVVLPWRPAISPAKRSAGRCGRWLTIRQAAAEPRAHGTRWRQEKPAVAEQLIFKDRPIAMGFLPVLQPSWRSAAWRDGARARQVRSREPVLVSITARGTSSSLRPRFQIFKPGDTQQAEQLRNPRPHNSGEN